MSKDVPRITQARLQKQNFTDEVTVIIFLTINDKNYIETKNFNRWIKKNPFSEILQNKSDARLFLLF